MRGILVAGHLALDYTPELSGFARLLGGPEFAGRQLNSGAPRPQDYFGQMEAGKLYSTGGLAVTVGGCVSNVGRALAHFGAPSRLVARVGDDCHADLVQTQLSAAGLELRLRRGAQLRTSTSLVLNLPGCDRIFWHDAGANVHFTGADLEGEDFAWAQLFHFGYPPLLPYFYRNPEALAELFARAQAAGCRCSLDLVAMDEGQEAARADWPRILAKALPYVDYFVPSFEELAALLLPERYRELRHKARGGDVCALLDWEEDVYPLAHKALDLGCKELLLKCGLKGLCLCRREADGSIFCQCQEAIPARRLVSASGAGDTAIAAFLLATVQGLSTEFRLGLAALAGSHAVESADSLAEMPSWEGLQAEWTACSCGGRS